MHCVLRIHSHGFVASRMWQKRFLSGSWTCSRTILSKFDFAYQPSLRSAVSSVVLTGIQRDSLHAVCTDETDSNHPQICANTDPNLPIKTYSILVRIAGRHPRLYRDSQISVGAILESLEVVTYIIWQLQSWTCEPHLTLKLLLKADPIFSLLRTPQ